MTCKCGPPHAMERCIHPFTRKPKYPLYKGLEQKPTKRRNGVKSTDPNSAPSIIGAGWNLGMGVVAVVVNALLAAVIC